MKRIDLIVKLLALPLSCGIASVLLFASFGVLSGKELGSFNAMPLFFVIGAIFGGVAGLPIVLLVDWKLSSWRYRYIVLGPLSALFAWLIFEGAFGQGAWQKLWVNPYFWMEWAPRRVIIYMTIGLLSATIFTGIVSVVGRWRSK